MPTPDELTQDQDFQNASSQDQHGYLLNSDPDYAKASPDDQKSYREHVTTITNPEAMLSRSQEQAKTAGWAPLKQAAEKSGQGADYLASIAGQDHAPTSPEEANSQLGDTLKRYGGGELALYGSTFMPSKAAVVRTAIGAGGGGYIGGHAGKYFGDLISPEAGNIGEKIGAFGGGIAGGYEGYHTMPEAVDEVSQAVKNRQASWIPTRVPKEMPTIDPLDQAIKEGRASRIPTTMPKVSEAPDEVSQAVKNRTASWLPTTVKRPAVGSASQEAGYYPGVTKVPIRPEPPYKLTPESVPGPDTSGKGNLLTPLAKQGDARAAMELKRRGRNALFVPAETDYAPPKSVTRFPRIEP